MYLFTDEKFKAVELKDFVTTRTDTTAEQALVYRKRLEKKAKKPIIAWAIMGGDNHTPDLTRLLDNE